MGRKKSTGELEIFAEFPQRSQQFYKIRRECGRFPTMAEVLHYSRRYGEKFFALIFCFHHNEAGGIDKCE